MWCDACRTGLFDVMAHPDLVKKFGHRPSFDPRDLYAEAARTAAETGVLIEVSTAGLRKPVGELYPGPDLLQRLLRRRGCSDGRLGCPRPAGRRPRHRGRLRRTARPPATDSGVSRRRRADGGRSHYEAQSPLATSSARSRGRFRPSGPRSGTGAACSQAIPSARSPESCSRSTPRATRSVPPPSSGCNVLVTHHPAFLKAPEWLTPGRGAAGVVFSAMDAGVALVNAHTNLDRAPDGRNAPARTRSASSRCARSSARTMPMTLVTVFVPARSAERGRSRR